MVKPDSQEQTVLIWSSNAEEQLSALVSNRTNWLERRVTEMEHHDELHSPERKTMKTTQDSNGAVLAPSTVRLLPDAPLDLGRLINSLPPDVNAQGVAARSQARGGRIQHRSLPKLLWRIPAALPMVRGYRSRYRQAERRQ